MNMPATITSLRWKQGLLRRLIPFQSWPQFLSWFVLVALVFLGGRLLISALGSFMPDHLLAIGAIFGSVPSLVLTIPGTLRIARPGFDALPIANAAFRQLGYIASDGKDDGTRVYVLKGPRWLR